MCLFGKVGGTSDNVVFAFLDGGDEGRPLRVNIDHHPIAHGNRVGALDIFQTEIALYLTFDVASIVCTDGIPTARVLNDKSLHASA